jgi:hypothetical protein
MIRLLLAAAVGLFVLSLPLTKTKLGGQLRIAAGVCFALALVPSLLFGLFFQPVPAPLGHPDPATIGTRIGTGLSCLGALVILSLFAYAILALRTKLFRPKKDPWDIFFARGGGKKRVQPKDPVVP